jgi:hypothetical protein
MNDLLDRRREQMFPKLNARQIARLELHGAREGTHAGQILVQRGDRPGKFFVLVACNN